MSLKICCDSKSLKVIRIYAVVWGVCKFILVFRCNCVSVFYRFWDNLRRIMACHWNLSYGSILASVDRSHTSSYSPSIHCNYGPVLYRFRDKARYWSKIAIISYRILHNKSLGEMTANIFVLFLSPASQITAISHDVSRVLKSSLFTHSSSASQADIQTGKRSQ